MGGIDVTVTSGGDSADLKVIPGESTHEIERPDGQLLERVQGRDYLILVSELTAGGITLPLQRHATVVEGADTHKVLSAGGDAHWKYTDPTKTVIRVHTKKAS